MRFFRPEIEAAVKTVGVLTLIGLLVVPFAWGYEQWRQARTWQAIACAYQLRAASAQRAPMTDASAPCGRGSRSTPRADSARDARVL